MAPLVLLCVLAIPACAKEKAGVRAISLLGEGVINDPKNKSLRFDLLKFGFEEFCKEMRVRGTPLKMRDEEPVLGRFFADNCGSQVIDTDNRQSFIVQYSGKGYAWTNVTERLGFKSTGLIEYAPDFQLHEKAMYIYFRPRNIDSSSFETTLVESELAKTGIAVTGVNPNEIGKDILDSQLKRGFTVIRYSSRGETEFGMGFIPLGQTPPRPFRVVRSDKITLDNDRTEVHSGQQDFIGGFRVTDDDQALYMTLKVDGAPAVDVFVVPKATGDQLIEQYVKNPGPVGLAVPPLLDEAVPAGQHFKRFIALEEDNYYLMIDHSSVAGRTAPPAIQGDDRAARLDYIVQLGDEP